MVTVKTLIKRGQDIKQLYPIFADVTLYGIKRPDTAKFKYTIESDINEEDEISYIQDVADVDYLEAVWNFQLSTRDEGGYDFDGDDLSEDRFELLIGSIDVNQGTYALTFDALNQGVTIPTSTQLERRCDFSKQFDIFILATPDNTQLSGITNPIIFSKYNGSFGLEIGMTNVNNTWRAFIRYIQNGTVFTQTGEEIITTSGDAQASLIRCWKDGTNTLYVSVNDIDDIVIPNVNFSLHAPDTNIIFGNGNSNGDYKGKLHQIRIYSGSHQTSANASIIFASRFTPTTMKFAGIVINVESDGKIKTVQCRSWGDTLYSKTLSSRLYESATPSDIRTGNVYNTTTQLRPIFDDMLELVDNTLTIKTRSSLVLVDEASIIGVGRSSLIFSILLESLDMVFTVTPRRLVIIEPAEGLGTNHVFRHNATRGHSYNITSSEQRNFKAVSDVLLIGYDGVEGYRNIINRNKTLVLKLPFVTGEMFLERLSQKLETSLNSRLNRYQIKSPALTNHIRPYQKVCAVSISGKVPPNNPAEDDMSGTPVAEIHYMYPAGTTDIQLGTNIVDYYDYQIDLDSQIRGAADFVATSDSTTTPPDPPAVNTRPTISITSPASSSTFEYREIVRLIATATDDEDGDISSDIQWSSSRDPTFNLTGSNVITTNLSIGRHTITASITDSDGAVSTRLIRLTILEPLPSSVGAVNISRDGFMVTLTWPNIPNVTSYRIYRRVGSSSFSLVSTRFTNSYVDTSLDSDNAGQTISYYVVSVNDRGVSPNSSTVSITLPSLPSRPDDIDAFNRNVPSGSMAIRIEPDNEDDAIDLTYSSTSSNSGFSNLRLIISGGESTNDGRIYDDRVALRAEGFSIPSNDTRIYIWHRRLNPGQTYYYRAYTRDDAGRSSSFVSTSESAA